VINTAVTATATKRTKTLQTVHIRRSACYIVDRWI